MKKIALVLAIATTLISGATLAQSSSSSSSSSSSVITRCGGGACFVRINGREWWFKGNSAQVKVNTINGQTRYTIIVDGVVVKRV